MASSKHKMVWVGRDSSCSTLCKDTSHQTRWLQAMEHVKGWGRHLWGPKDNFWFLFRSYEPWVFCRPLPNIPCRLRRSSLIIQASSPPPLLGSVIPGRPQFRVRVLPVSQGSLQGAVCFHINFTSSLVPFSLLIHKCTQCHLWNSGDS